MKEITQWDKIDELLNRGVHTIYPSKEALEKVLRSGKKLKLYQGFDPTGTQLHIGHAVAIMKLKLFQDLGHEVIFLVGDGTGQAGDPSGKTKARERFLTREELRKNARDYVNQANRIVLFDGPNPVKILYNGDWLNKLTLVDILNIAQHFSLQQISERDIFRERMKRKETVNLRESLYPLLQAYDSVAMKIDLELGGTDQTFNMLAGRKLVKEMLGKEKFVMTVPLLADASGTKIGKTEGNVIGITDPPDELYGKVMNLPDSAIIPCFEMITDIPMLAVQQMQQKLDREEVNPMELKKKLAWTLVKQYNDEKAANNAQEVFEKKYQSAGRREGRGEVAEAITITKKVPLVDLVIDNYAGISRSQAKRLIYQRAVQINGTTMTDPTFTYTPKKGDIIEIGKHKVFKIVTGNK